MATDVVAGTTVYSQPALRSRQEARVAHGLAAEEAAGRLLALKGRTIALIAVAALLTLVAPFPDVLFYEGCIALFIVAGFARHTVEYFGLFRWWQPYVQTAFDSAFLAFVLVVPNPVAEVQLPPQMYLRFGNFVYFYVLLVALVFGYKPLQVIWGGIAAALSWSVVTAWIISLPETIIHPPIPVRSAESVAAVFAVPTYVDIDMVLRDIVVFLIIAALLAGVVARSRQLVERQASLERERGNLARYFSPATVDRLARQDAALAQVREQDVAVLFADLVGFTHWSERHAPAEVIGMLREVHARLEEAVFRHHGTLDKFIGDGLMATFGTPDPGPRDATNAVTCLTAIVADFGVWNARRALRGRNPIRISVGLHYGPVVVGNIGTDRRLEFAVLGDTVNVASRLESLTRELDCAAAISGAVAEAVRHEAPEEADAILAGFVDCGAVTLRGRDEKVRVLTYG